MAGGAETAHIAALPAIVRLAPFRDCLKELFRPKWRNCMSRDSTMKTMSAREAKNGFGLMIDTARAAPVLIEKHGRGVVIVMSVEEYERLSLLADGAANAKGKVVEVSKRV